MSAVREDFTHNSHVSTKTQIKFVEDHKVFAGVKEYGFACTNLDNPVKDSFKTFKTVKLHRNQSLSTVFSGDDSQCT